MIDMEYLSLYYKNKKQKRKLSILYLCVWCLFWGKKCSAIFQVESLNFDFFFFKEPSLKVKVCIPVWRPNLKPRNKMELVVRK